MFAGGFHGGRTREALHTFSCIVFGSGTATTLSGSSELCGSIIFSYKHQGAQLSQVTVSLIFYLLAVDTETYLLIPPDLGAASTTGPSLNLSNIHKLEPSTPLPITSHSAGTVHRVQCNYVHRHQVQ